MGCLQAQHPLCKWQSLQVVQPVPSTSLGPPQGFCCTPHLQGPSCISHMGSASLSLSPTTGNTGRTQEHLGKGFILTRTTDVFFGSKLGGAYHCTTHIYRRNPKIKRQKCNIITVFLQDLTLRLVTFAVWLMVLPREVGSRCVPLNAALHVPPQNWSNLWALSTFSPGGPSPSPLALLPFLGLFAWFWVPAPPQVLHVDPISCHCHPSIPRVFPAPPPQAETPSSFTHICTENQRQFMGKGQRSKSLDLLTRTPETPSSFQLSEPRNFAKSCFTHC